LLLGIGISERVGWMGSDISPPPFNQGAIRMFEARSKQYLLEQVATMSQTMILRWKN
jgi:hypothetical protein